MKITVRLCFNLECFRVCRHTAAGEIPAAPTTNAPCCFDKRQHTGRRSGTMQQLLILAGNTTVKSASGWP